MKFTNFIQLSVVVLCFASSCRSDDSLIGAFNDIYSTCLVNLNTDCIQPKALEWISRVMQKREIHITDDLSLVKNEAVLVSEGPAEETSRDNRINLISTVDDFLATHYLNIRYPKAVISDNVPSFLVSTLNRMIPESLQVPLEEGNPSEGRGLVKKVLVPFLLGLKFKTTVLLPLAFALIALKAWKALTLGLISLVVSTAVVVFKLAKPKVINYEVVHYPHHHLDHAHHHLDTHLDAHHFDHHLDAHHFDHHLDHLDVHPVPVPVQHGHIDHLHAAHDIAYPAHL